MLVNLDRVYSYIQSKDFGKNLNHLGHSADVYICPQKNERQHKKPVIDGIRSKDSGGTIFHLCCALSHSTGTIHL